MALTPNTNPTYRLQFIGNTAVLQPVKGKSIVGDSLVIDTARGVLTLMKKDLMVKDYMEVLGVLGMCRLKTVTAIAVITGIQQVAKVCGAAVYSITRTQVLLPPTSHVKLQPDETKFLELFRDAVDPAVYGSGMYFAYDADLTLRRQVAMQSDSSGAPLQPVSCRAFFWNYHISVPMLSINANNFVLRVINGFIGQLDAIKFREGYSGSDATLTLIARRSTLRCGTRYWRRGADMQGNAANMAETEQIIEFSDGSIASYVLLRGSIPVLWSQIPNIKYKPTTRLASSSTYVPVFVKHMKDLSEQYHAVTAINLAGHHGSEGRLSKAFRQASVAQTLPGVRLEEFDFHAQCGSSRYENLEHLWSAIEGDFHAFGFFMADGSRAVKARQMGVFRVNCVDSLDRTNVAQAFIARRALETILQHIKILTPSGKFHLAFPLVEKQFKVLWADHGDAISMGYAGTGALKSGFTRTGVRSADGFIDDGIKSVVRYYLNNFEDGRRQDALDLLAGHYQVDAGKRNPFNASVNAFWPVLLATFFMTIAASYAWNAAFNNHRDRTTAIIATVATIVGTALVAWLNKHGKKFVNKPALCPELVQPW